MAHKTISERNGRENKLGDISFYKDKNGTYFLMEYNKVILMNATMDQIIEKLKEIDKADNKPNKGNGEGTN